MHHQPDATDGRPPERRRRRPGDGEEQVRAEIQDTSDDLLAAVDEIRRLESEKRQVRMSTPEFHEKAKRIERKSREVFGLAKAEREVGDALRGQQSDSINEQAAEEGDKR
jgi:hypothetical protein